VPHRIRVLGCSGSGKTTLARELARRLDVPHLELDAVNHREGWREATPEEFAAALDQFLADATGGWVACGNYTRRTDGLTEQADTVVWLDYPRRLVMARVLRRTAGRVVLRQELWNGNRESVRKLLRREPAENIVLWTWTAHAGYVRRFLPQWESHREPGSRPRWVRLRSPRETARWLDEVAP